MILVDFSKIAHWESADGKVNFQIIAVLNWRMKFSIKDYFSKCESLIENFILVH